MPTNEQVWKFYLDKPEESLTVKAYLEGRAEGSGNAYLGLYDDFRALCRGLPGLVTDSEDAGFYDYLLSHPLACLNPKDARVPPAGEEAKVNDLGWFLYPATYPDKVGRAVPSPKWHLYVSYFALEAYWGHTGKEQWDWKAPFNGSAIHNKALLLWMAEGADMPMKIPSLGKILDAIGQKS